MIVSGLSLSGAKAGNRVLSVTSVTDSGTIDRAIPTVTSGSAASKTYDGTPAATLGGPTTVTAFGSDAVAPSGTGTATFADKNVSTGKAVTGCTLTGFVGGTVERRAENISALPSSFIQRRRITNPSRK